MCTEEEEVVILDMSPEEVVGVMSRQGKLRRQGGWGKCIRRAIRPRPERPTQPACHIRASTVPLGKVCQKVIARPA